MPIARWHNGGWQSQFAIAIAAEYHLSRIFGDFLYIISRKLKVRDRDLFPKREAHCLFVKIILSVSKHSAIPIETKAFILMDVFWLVLHMQVQSG